MNTDNRLCGILAYGKQSDIISILEVIHALPADDYEVAELKMDLRIAIDKLELTNVKERILDFTFRGVSSNGTALFLGVSKQYIRRVRAEIIEALSDEFKKIVSKREYQDSIDTRKRHSKRIEAYKGTTYSGVTGDSDEVTEATDDDYLPEGDYRTEEGYLPDGDYRTKERYLLEYDDDI